MMMEFCSIPTIPTYHSKNQKGMSSSKKESKQNIKLRLIAWDKNSKAEVGAAGYATTLDLTLNAKKNWSSVVQHLSRKWANINNIGNRLQIFSVDSATQKPTLNYLSSQLSVTVGHSLSTHPSLSQNNKAGAIPTIQLFYHLPNPQQTQLFGGQNLLHSGSIPSEILYQQPTVGNIAYPTRHEPHYFAPQHRGTDTTPNTVQSIYGGGNRVEVGMEPKQHTAESHNSAPSIRSSLHTMPLLLSSGILPIPIVGQECSSPLAIVGNIVPNMYNDHPSHENLSIPLEGNGMLGDETMACLAEFDGGGTLPHLSPEGKHASGIYLTASGDNGAVRNPPDKCGDTWNPSEKSLMCFSDSIVHFFEEFAHSNDGGNARSLLGGNSIVNGDAKDVIVSDVAVSEPTTIKCCLGKRALTPDGTSKDDVEPTQHKETMVASSSDCQIVCDGFKGVIAKMNAPQLENRASSPVGCKKKQRLDVDTSAPGIETDHEGETSREFFPPSTPPTHKHQTRPLEQSVMDSRGKTPMETEMIVHSESSCQSVSPSSVHVRIKDSKDGASATGNASCSGISRLILMPNKRKPHLKRITPTFVSKLHNQK